jgi:cytochrome b subunit of formate dehydrogenase
MVSMILMRGKYLLHMINEIVSMVGHLRHLIYTYKYKEIILYGEA